jgi:hypothetical protein
MDQRITIEFKITKEDRVYTFSMPYGCAHGESYDVVYEILMTIADMAKQRAESLQRNEDDDVK